MDKQPCPEFECGIRLRRNELLAHLQWDHNRPEHKAEQMIRDKCTFKEPREFDDIHLHRKEGFWDARVNGIHGTGDTREEALRHLGKLLDESVNPNGE